MSLGDRIRAIRGERGLSATALARRAKVSTGFISQVEKERSRPSLEVLRRIALALEVPIGTFFETTANHFGEGQEGTFLIRRGEHKRINFPHGRASYALLTPDLKRNIECLWIELAPGEQSGTGLVTHPCEECAVVVRGTLHIWFEDEEVELREGDSIWFKCTRPHRIGNTGRRRSVSIWAITPPAY